MTLECKGFFTWKIPNCEKGNPKQIANYAKAAGLSHLVVKIADGMMVYNGIWGDQTDYTTPVVNALRARGIKVWGWHYIYGDNPISEANVGIARIRQYNLDGYVIDVEKEFKASGKKVAAKKFMDQVRSTLPNLPIALSSYRYPSLHPQVPWTEFLDQCDIIMPQVYWMKAHNPGDQLARCVNEFRAKVPVRPIVPTGAAFREYGWQPTDSEVLEFFQKARELNLSAVNFWEWSDARSGNLPRVWETIQEYKWRKKDDPKDICENLIDGLNTHNIDKILNLYTLPAVHINGNRTTQGFENLSAWYNTMLTDMLPDCKFNLGSYTGKGSSRHLTWSASSTKGIVRNGSDTLGLSKGKISYHYSFFTVTPLNYIAG
jgi:hypothetical protein